jgi:hypothetical protein
VFDVCNGDATEDICGDCGGTGETLDDCIEGYQLYFGEVNEEAGTAEVWYSAEGEISGAQFNVTGVILTGAGGGIAEENGWVENSSATTWLGFSFSAATVPSGINLLTVVSFEASEAADFCLTGIVFSGEGAETLDVEAGECAEILGSDCNGVIEGDAVVDECGTCDNDPANDCVQLRIFYDFAQDITGFQFDVNGVELVAGSTFDGNADMYFDLIENNTLTVVGVSTTAAVIPLGSGVLTNLMILGDVSNASISNVILTDVNALEIASVNMTLLMLALDTSPKIIKFVNTPDPRGITAAVVDTPTTVSVLFSIRSKYISALPSNVLPATSSTPFTSN